MKKKPSLRNIFLLQDCILMVLRIGILNLECSKNNNLEYQWQFFYFKIANKINELEES